MAGDVDVPVHGGCPHHSRPRHAGAVLDSCERASERAGGREEGGREGKAEGRERDEARRTSAEKKDRERENSTTHSLYNTLYHTQVLDLADRYMIDGLKRLCEAVLVKAISLKNLVSILEAANHYSAAYLQQVFTVCIHAHTQSTYATYSVYKCSI
jgi:hypothetical protein